MDNINISCNLETNICGPTKEEELQDIKIEKQEKIMVFLEAVSFVNVNQEKFLEDYKSQKVKQRLIADQEIGKSMNVGGFPTFIFLCRQNSGYRLSGINDYDKLL